MIALVKAYGALLPAQLIIDLVLRRSVDLVLMQLMLVNPSSRPVEACRFQPVVLDERR